MSDSEKATKFFFKNRDASTLVGGDVTGTLGTWPGKLEKALVFTWFFEFFGKGTCFHVIFWNFFGLLARKIGKGTCPKCPKRVPKVPVTPPPLVGNSLNLVGLSTCLAVLNNLSGADELGGADD